MSAFYRLEVKPISRQLGRSAVGSAAYRSGKNALSAAAYRNGSTLVDDKTGQSFDYSKKIGVWGSEIIAPAHAPAWMRDRSKLWNAVETIESRKNSLLAKDHIISLPYQLNREQGEAAIREFVKGHFVDKGMVADVAFHKYGTPYKAWAKTTEAQLASWRAEDLPFYEKAEEPDSAGGSFILVLRNRQGGIKEYAEYQPHAHVMMPMRLVEENGFAAHKIRAPNGAHTKAWETQQLRVTRQEWEIVCNRHLAAAGSEARVDCRTNGAQGIERIPQPKVGQLATKKERAGEPTLAGQDRRNVVELNAEIKALKIEHAKAEAEVIDLQLHRLRKSGMDADATKEASTRQQPGKVVEAVDQLRAEEDRARATLRREADATAQRAEALKSTAQREAEKATKERDEHVRAEERRAHEGAISSAASRYAIALGENYDIRDPYSSLARAAMSEGAMFQRRQMELSKELSEAKTPEQRHEIGLRKEIEANEYMGLTSHRIAGINEAVGGEGHKRSAILEHARGDAFDQRAKELREERAAFLALPEQQRRAEMAEKLGGLAQQIEKGAFRDDDKRGQADGRNQKESAESKPNQQPDTAATTGRPREEKDAASTRAGGKDYSHLSEEKQAALAALRQDFAQTDQRNQEAGQSRSRGRGR